MTRAERRQLYRSRRIAAGLAGHPSPVVHTPARQTLLLADKVEQLDPRPSLRLRLKLRLQGVDAG